MSDYTINGKKVAREDFVGLVAIPFRNLAGEPEYLQRSVSGWDKKVLYTVDMDQNVLKIVFWVGQNDYLSIKRQCGITGGEWEMPELGIEDLIPFLHGSTERCRFKTTKSARS
jgi:hypothetical protein